MTIKHVKKGIQRIEDMDTSANFIQNSYTFTKKHNKEWTEEHREETKRMIGQITNPISKIVLHNTEINIKCNNIV